MKLKYQDILGAMAEAVQLASLHIRTDFTGAAQSLVMGKPSKSNLPDFVTGTDIAAQSIMQNYLADKFPDIGFLGEEGGAKLTSDASYFLVDPIDGTSNFVAIRDYFACCAAYVEGGIVRAAVIADPMKGCMVKAYQGGGVVVHRDFNLLEDTPLRGIGGMQVPLAQMQMECELAMNTPEHFDMVRKLVGEMSGVRKSGSTALDMMYMAIGRKMALISTGLEPYDLAAGLLIVREAGGVVTDMSGETAVLGSSDILAANPFTHGEILKILSAAP